MLKKLFTGLLTGLIICASVQSQAKDGYKVTVKFTDIKDSFVYLAHYYGKSLPTIFKTDSAKIDKNGIAVMQGKEKIIGGIYIILLADKKNFFDFLMDNGDDVSITATIKDLPQGLKFSGTQQGKDFGAYGDFLATFGAKQQQLNSRYANAPTAADSAAVYKEITASAQTLYDYRNNYIKKNPTSLLAKVFGALSLPQVPEGTHYLPDGKVDSNFGYNYYKAHYWDKFDFHDERLIYTPLYDAKLDEYMNRLVLQYEDSVVKESDILLTKTRGCDELFKYTLWWLTNNAGQSKVMGMDAVYVHLVETYYMKGDATWLKPDELQQYITTARKIAPNVIGNLAPEIKLKDINGKERSLQDVNAKYTLVLFWSPDCGHCQLEVPKLDSVYRAVLKSKGVKIYAVSTFDEEKPWKEFVQKNKLEDWIHVSDSEHTSRFREQYNVYMTPIIYLLDDKKIIRGKRLDYSNIAGLIEMLERQEKNKNKAK